MCRVTGERGHIVPQVQMAPRINQPQRVQAACAGAMAWGWAPIHRAYSTCCIPAHQVMGRAGPWWQEAALCIATGAKNEVFRSEKF